MPSRTRTPDLTLKGLAAATMLFVSFAPAQAKDDIDPAAYPELAPEALLPTVLAELRHTLPDIYSVREMRLCPANRIKLKDGKPVNWAVRFEYNAKNQSGGYTGVQRGVAIFRNGRIAFPIGNTPQLGRTGLDGLLSKTVDRQMAACRAIPDGVIQQVLAATQP